MVRIRVIHASRLLAAAAAIILVIALAVLVISSAGRAQTVSETAAQAVAAAFSFLRPPAMEFELRGENEHTDRVVGNGMEIEVARNVPERRSACPRVLIYHTHTHEAYAQTDADPYAETETWRTEDQAHSVVRVGNELARLLAGRGFEVIHDTSDYEYPRLNTAYARSLEALQSRRDQAFDLCIDLHRDAWDASMAECADLNGERAAQLMALVGNGGDYEEKPDYEANLAFATRLTNCLNGLQEGICRPVLVKNGRYNQHVFTPSVLIEVGHNLNTLPEALASMTVLAEALDDLLKAD